MYSKRKNIDGMKVNETKVRVPLLYWIPLLICAVILFFADLFEMQFFTITLTKPLYKNTFFEQQLLDGFTINTPGCKIPYMDPFDPHIIKFIENATKSKCNKGKPPLFQSNLTSVYLLPSSLPKYQINNTSDLQCCYIPFWREKPKEGKSDDNIIFSKTCYDFQGSTNVAEEFIKVTCKYDNTTIYVDTFSFIPLKNVTNIKADSEMLNVLVIGLDGVSRLNLHRQMIKTVKYLKEQEAVELLGYNKVADNTFPNLMPVLTGSFENELKKTCWPKKKDRFDNCSFIWKHYKQKGHLTVYGEDSTWMGVFNYLRYGFKKQTTDYAYNYFNGISEKLIGNHHTGNVFECEGGRLVYTDLLDYITKFVITMETNNLPYFGFFWGASLSHDVLNKPKSGDQDYYLFFKKLVEERHLNNTVMIFMSDHGIRWGGIRQTFQGRMEERLPFVFILLPKVFKEKYNTAYNNLKMNTMRLTTPFDLHETLVDLANPSDLLIEENSKGLNQSKRGISLLRPINKKRTCDDAAITSNWCTCQQSIEINITSKVVDAAKAAVNNINSQLKGYAQCAKLTLDVILNARLMVHQFTGSNKIYDYMLTMKTLPSEAIFEVTVRSNEKSFEVIGSISRLNLYGKQSSCITDFHLKLYCYCKSLLL